MTIPFPDESIIANLDNIISIFSDSSEKKFLSEDDLLRTLGKTLEDLKTVKLALGNLNVEALTENFSSSDDNEDSNVELSNSESDEGVTKNDIVRSSIDMLKNGGKFTKLVNNKNFSKKSSGNSSSKSDQKDSARNSLLPTRSSLLNAITVSTCPLNRRKSPPNNKRITHKISRQLLLKKAEKKVERKQQQPLKTESKSPKITGTHYATCRIHHYEDNSHTFEIINPSRVNCFGDGNEKSEIVIIVLANGQTALFTSKSSKSFKDVLSFGESQ